MTKRTVVAGVSAALLSSVLVHADPPRFGFKAGPTLSFARPASVIYNPTDLWAYSLGLFVAYPVGPGMSLQAEVLLARKGTRYYDAGVRAEQSFRLDYLELPVLFNARLFHGPVEVFAGPYVALLLHSTANDSTHHWAWWDTRVARNDYGISTGARVDVMKHLFAEVRLDAGLRKAVYDLFLPDNAPHRNLTLSLLLGYRR